MPREIIECKSIPIPVARKILEERIESEESTDIQRKTYNYLLKFSKCNPEVAEQVYKELIETFNLKDDTAAMLVNILPETIDEARIVLTVEDKVFTTEEVKKILQVLHKCKEE